MNEKISRVLDIPIEITAILGRTKMWGFRTRRFSE